ncbi:MAG: hypothetical protein JWL95_1025 [Gemmatimonadetes bacterium]|nr:hypothetical protein [Gemmatimonadota bacterium]
MGVVERDVAAPDTIAPPPRKVRYLKSRGSTVRYVLKQKLLSWGDDYYIRDDQGREVYLVDGKAISWGGQLSFRDMEGRELAFIKQKLLKLSPTYEIYRDGELAAVVKKELFALLHHRFTVDVPGPDDLEARGDFLDHEYVLTRGDREVARVSKRWLSLSDTYGVETADGEDDVLILASAVVVDQVCHRDDGERH